MASAAWRMRRWWWLALLVVIGAAALAFLALKAGLYPGAEPAPAFPYGEIRIGVDASYAPFALSDDGQLAGLDIAVGEAIGEELNMPVRFVNIGIDGLYDALLADQVDILISALQPESWRMGDVRYTRPYFNAGLMLVSPANAAIHEMKALSGHELAYEFGSAGDNEARRWLRRIAPFETQPYELPEHALDAVRLDVADAALADAVSVQLYLREHPNWEVHRAYVTHVPYAVAVPRDRVNTFKQVDEALAELHRQGVIDTIIDRWL